MTPEFKQINNTSLDEVWSRILSIEEECFPEDLRFSEEELLDNCGNSESILITVSDNGDIAGFCNVRPAHTLDYLDFETIEERKDTLYVVDIAVRKKYQNRGLGTLMLKYLMESTAAKRYSAHVVSSSSQSMFKKAGFTDAGTFEKWMGEHSSIYMTCGK